MIVTTRTGRVASYILVAGFTLTPATASAELLSEMKAYVVTTGDDGQPSYETADTVKPGQVIMYQMTHTNTFDNSIGGVAIVGPVPDGSILIANSYATSKPATVEVRGEFDADEPGEEWSTLPATRTIIRADGSRTTEILGEESFTAIRWKLDGSLQAGEEVINQYRVRVLNDNETAANTVTPSAPAKIQKPQKAKASSPKYKYGWMTGKVPGTPIVAANVVREPEFVGRAEEQISAIEKATTAVNGDYCDKNDQKFLPDPGFILFDKGINEWIIGGVCQ
jgi:hypothetical protein